MEKKLTLSKQGELHIKYTAVNNFLMMAKEKGVLKPSSGIPLQKYLKELLKKDDPLNDDYCEENVGGKE